MKEKQIIRFEYLPDAIYKEAWEYQTKKHKALIDNKLANRDLEPGTYPQEQVLLLVEHLPVFTLGRSGSAANLLLSEDELRSKGIDYYPINRGGDITYHGPGQLVGYPILDLELFKRDVHWFVRQLEEVIIRTLLEYGLNGSRIEGYTGVWIFDNPKSPATHPDAGKKRKICAIGVHLSRWVSLHGWAFNINTELNYFEYIVPCGIVDPDKSVTSLEQELGRKVDMAEVRTKIIHHFAEVFECVLQASN